MDIHAPENDSRGREPVDLHPQHEAPIRGADRVTRNAEFMVHGRYNTLDAGTLELLPTVRAVDAYQEGLATGLLSR